MDLLHLPEHVKLMVVTKNQSVLAINNVIKQHSVKLIGESRWQEAKQKIDYYPKNIPKHFIGHVQTNKAKEIIEAFDCIESVDSLKLINIIDKSVETLHAMSLRYQKYPIFLQVNISNDPNKHGFMVSELNKAIEHCHKMFHVELLGLMTITAKQTKEAVKQDFKKMKQLQIKHCLKELSMGMSADWDLAVEEGATIIRIGNKLFNNY
ncbi:MAG: YggS family pyridoxal phosphate-dependent enzyme [Patescibacteria group bacterium]|jgi:hypothetical protein